MPWQFYFIAFSYGKVLCLVDSMVYRSGVQYDVAISNLIDAGCERCYEAPYGSVSELEDIRLCSGPYLFVGMQKGGKQALEVGALAPVDVLHTKASKSATHMSNGVYWHLEEGCTFGFFAIEYDEKSIEEESIDSVVSTNHGVSWSIGQSIACKFHNELVTYSTVDTSSWTKHVHNCPEPPTPAFISDGIQPGSIERGEGEGGEEGEGEGEGDGEGEGEGDGEGEGEGEEGLGSDGGVGRYLSELIPFIKKVNLSTNQVYTLAPELPKEIFINAVRRTVRAITNASDIVITIDGIQRLYAYNITRFTCLASLRESQPGSAMKLLNASISDNRFAKSMSKILKVPLTLNRSYWFVVKKNYLPYAFSAGAPSTIEGGDYKRAMLFLLALVCSCMVGGVCYYHRKTICPSTPAVEDEVQVEAEVVAEAVTERDMEAQVTEISLWAAQEAPLSEPPSVSAFMLSSPSPYTYPVPSASACTYSSLPPAQATPISPEAATLYEIAAVEVTSNTL